MLADEADSLREARRREGGDVHRFGRAVEDPFGEAETDGGRDLESRAAEPAVEPEALGTDRPDGGMLVGGDAVVTAVRGVESAALHERDALAETVHGALHEARAGVA